ncbi:MAG: Bax inhibitor-1/YccA family protein [Bdellovibrionales bacterium]|jgi:FtsH-binding integral membrane protein|nr:Bax inhibitor-1/YccA family protein [Bdellovibrionales bacterium]
MSYDPYHPQATVAAQGTDVDAGLQSFMRGVYNSMSIGLVITGLVAFGFAQMVMGSEQLAHMVYGTPLKWVVAFAPLAFLLGGFTQGRMLRWPASKLQMMFFVFSGVMGLSMSSIFMMYSAESIARVFFITAGMFAATSLYGYTTKRDLSGMGGFMIMGLIGLIIASIVNIFLASSMLHFITSVAGVVIFTGLTAWDTQRLKETYAYGSHMAEANAKMAVMGALNLYLNFVLLFQHLMSLMGSRE